MAEKFLKQIAFTDTNNVKWWGYTFPGFGTVEPTQKTSVIGTSKYASRFDHSHKTNQLIEITDFLFMKNAERTKLATYPATYSEVRKYVNEQVLGGTYKGAVNYVSNLPSTANDGDIYSVLIGTNDAPAGDYRFHNATQDPTSGHPTGWYMVSSNRVPLATASYNGLLASADYTYIQTIKNSGLTGLIPVNSTVVTNLHGTTGSSTLAARADHLHDARYLRKDLSSAQSVTGPVTFTKPITIGAWGTSDIRDTAGNAFLGGDTGNTYVSRLIGTTYIRSGNTTLIHRKNNTDYDIWDKSMLTQTRANYICHMEVYDERDIKSEYSSGTVSAAISKPGTLKDKSLAAIFSMTGMPTNAWHSGIAIKGWTGVTYASWELVGPASTTVDNNLYFRSGLNQTWNAWRKVAFWDDINTEYAKYLPLTAGTTKPLSGKLIASKGINLNAVGKDGISFYSTSYVTWYEYMTSAGAGNASTGGTASSYGEVTSWARRSTIENNAGYGWIWDSCANTANANPDPKMSLSANTGNLKVKGMITAPTFTGALSGNATTATRLQTARTLQIGNTSKSFNGSANVAWSLAEIGALAKAGDTATGLIKFNLGVQIGTTTDVGWYNNNNRITAGTSEARGVNVGSLLVSSAWADSSKVPTNGIYSKGLIHSAAGFYVQSNRGTTLNLARNASMISRWDSFGTGTTTAPGTDSISGQQITDGFVNTLFWDSDFGFQIVYDIDGTGIAYRGYTPSTGANKTGWKFLATTDWVNSKVSNGTVASANKLTTPRAINGTNFDGTAAITTAYWGTARTLTIGNTGKSVNGSANVAWSLAEIGAAATAHDHTRILAIDKRDIKPNGTNIGASIRGIEAYFASMSNFTSGYSGYGDTLILDTYGDSSGGNTNALVVWKSGMRILHAQGAWNGGTWQTTKPLAYLDDITWNNISGKPSTFAPSAHTHNYLPLTGGTLTGNLTVPQVNGNLNGIATKLGNTTSYAGYGTNLLSSVSGSAGILIKLPYNVTSNKMFQFTVRIYSSYKVCNIVCSGYLYNNSGGYIHEANAIMAEGNIARQVKIGKDASNNAYVWIGGPHNYTGVAITDIVGGYSGGNWQEGWSISLVDSSAITTVNFDGILYPNVTTDSLTWVNISGKPTTFTPSSHTHAWSQVTGAPATATRWPSWGEVTGKPTTFAPSAHTHDYVVGKYTGNGGVQPPSYAGANATRFNMMYANPTNNSNDGDTSYCDWIIMNNYSWSDVPYATAIGVSKKSSAPRAWIMCGPNSSDRTTWSRYELARKIDIPSIPSSLKNPYSLTIQQNGTTLGSYDGSVAKTINITATSVTLTKATVMAALNQTGTNTFTTYCDFTAGAGNSGSDMRFKKDVKDIPNILDRLMNIKVFSYIWNKENERKFDTIGVSANELLEDSLFAKLVHNREDKDKTQFVDYDRIGVLALKGLQEEVKKRTEENNNLKTEINKLKNVLNLVCDKIGINLSELIN